jgi:hypothetical protein
MTFFQLWLAGYTHPARFVDEIRSKPAPYWGFYAQLLRAVMDSLLVYLPLALMRRVPPAPSFLSFIPTEQYYTALIFLSPLVLMTEMLLQVAFVHVGLRLAGCPGNFDQLLNVVGMSALVVGAVLIPWDWFWVLTGWGNQILLGISHLVISLWAALIAFLALRRTFGAPAWLAVLLMFLSYPVGMPIAIMFMRSPL